MTERALAGRRVVVADKLLVMAMTRSPDTSCPAWDPAAALERVHAVAAEGADIVDVGGVTAGPDGEAGEREEIRRTVAFIAAVRDAYPALVISVDTWRHEVGRQACAAGADLVTDSSGGWDARLVEVAAERGAGLVCSPAVAARAVAAGADRARIIIEPAPGFGTEPSPEVTRRLADLAAAGWPVLVSPDQDAAEAAGQRPAGALATMAVCAWLGARVFRVRHVRQARRALDMVSAIRGDIPPARAVRGLALCGRRNPGRRAQSAQPSGAAGYTADRDLRSERRIARPGPASIEVS
jgi:dihydropteroate synthase